MFSGSYYSYRRYYDLKGKNLTSEFGLSQAFVLNFEHYLTLKETWLAFGKLHLLKSQFIVFIVFAEYYIGFFNVYYVEA